MEIGQFQILEPTVSFLDSISTKNARRYTERNGSIGNNILKRFKVWIDYRHKKIMLKKNGSFKGGFEYNMSGIEVVYNGKVLVEEKQLTPGIPLEKILTILLVLSLIILISLSLVTECKKFC